MHAWNEWKKTLEKILAFGAEKYFREIRGMDNAFPNESEMGRPREATCMDEGIRYGALRCAGSGILLPRNEALKLFKENNIDVVTSHEGCGAAEIAARGADAEEYAKKYAQSIANELGIKSRRIPFSEMKRAPRFHSAGILYVDCTGRFVPDRAPDIPLGYVVSARQLGEKNALSDSLLAAKISFGEHGFGGFFTIGYPFLVVLLGGMDGLADLLDKALKKEYRMRVRFCSFTPPAE